MQYTTLNELRLLENINETNVSKITETLNQNFEKGLISEELHEKACIQLENLIEKGGKAAQIGEIREHGGKKMQKTASGWIPVKESGSGGGEKIVRDEESEKNKTPITSSDMKSFLEDSNTSYYQSNGSTFVISNRDIFNKIVSSVKNDKNATYSEKDEYFNEGVTNGNGWRVEFNTPRGIERQKAKDQKRREKAEQQDKVKRERYKEQKKVADKKIESAAKKFGIKDVEKLKQDVYDDYEGGNLSKLTERDIAEIIDAGGLE